MTQPENPHPFGASPVPGVVHRRSPLSVPDSLERLTAAIEAAGATVFAVVDHSGEAERIGLVLRETKLVIFGSPSAGTPLMVSTPSVALDLPLKILVWADDQGLVWLTYLSTEWLADRYQLPPELTQPLAAVEALASRVAEGA
jgi:uncharacterized protein (DUF302 family)